MAVKIGHTCKLMKNKLKLKRSDQSVIIITFIVISHQKLSLGLYLIIKLSYATLKVIEIIYLIVNYMK